MKKKTTTNLRFGQAVRRFRHALDLSQESLAERAGLDRTYIGHVERGARNVSLATIAKLARALDIPAAALLSRSAEDALPLEESPREWIAECLDANCVGRKCVNILMVEDDPVAERATLRALKRAGIMNSVRVVNDAEQALAFLLSEQPPGIPAPRMPQLILLDAHLHHMDSREVLQRLKSDPRTRPIPVVVLATSHHPRELEELRQLGAAHCIGKPVGFYSLGRVTAQLHLKWALVKTANGSSP